MALALSIDGPIITCMLCACGGNCKDVASSGQSCKRIVEQFNPAKATPVTRMALHKFFGRAHRLDGILKRYESSVKSSEILSPKQRLRLLEDIVIADCKLDSDWQICSECETEYNTQARPFERVLFTTPEICRCSEHFSRPMMIH